MTRLRLKVNVYVDEKKDRSAETMEDRMEETIPKPVEDVRITIGPGAGAVFVLLESGEKLSSKLSGNSPDKIANHVANWLECDHYAGEVRIENWIIEPYDGETA